MAHKRPQREDVMLKFDQLTRDKRYLSAEKQAAVIAGVIIGLLVEIRDGIDTLSEQIAEKSESTNVVE